MVQKIDASSNTNKVGCTFNFNGNFFDLNELSTDEETP